MGRAHEVRKVAMAKTAAAKTKVYSKYGKEILIAAKAGVPDPDMNLALRRIIEKAKKDQIIFRRRKRRTLFQRNESKGLEARIFAVREHFHIHRKCARRVFYRYLRNR